VAGAPALAVVPVVALVAVLGGVLVARSAPPPTIDYAAAAALIAETEPVSADATEPTSDLDPAGTTGPTVGAASLGSDPVRVSFFGTPPP